MKKHFVSLVAFVSLLALASCSTPTSSTTSSSSSTTQNSTSTSSSSSSSSSSTTTTTSTPDEIDVESITLSETTLTLKVGETHTLTATILPEDATDKTLTWTTDNETVATVAGGVITAVGAGETVITATAANGVKATCTLTVEKATVELTSITISGATEVLVDEKITLTATPNAGATLEEVTWKSSDTTIATVENGVVTGVKAGTVEITASSGDITSAPYTIEVKDAIVEQGKFGLYQVTRGEARYFTGKMDGYYFGTTTDYAAAVDVIVYEAEGGVTLRIGEEGQYIGARLNDGHNNILMQDDPYVWMYDEEHDAYLTTLGEEDLFIGSSSNYDTLSLNKIQYIDVEGNNIAHVVQEEIPAPALESITISGPTEVAVGENITLSATPNLGAVIDELTWTSSDTEIATVENGVVTGVKAGTVEITASSGDITSAPYTIEVKDAVVPPTIVEQGKLGLYQVTLGKALYFTGEQAGNFLGTTTDYAAAADVIAYEAEGGVTLRIGEEGQYIGAIESGRYKNLHLQADPFVWKYDDVNDAYLAAFGDVDYYIGNYSDFDTFSLSESRYMTQEGNNIAHIVQEEIQGPALEGITITGPSQVVIGQTVTLSAKPSNMGAELGDVTWTSEDTKVATVDAATGVVTGVAEGKTNIVATYGEISAKYEISVITAEDVPDTITYNFAPAAGSSSTELGTDALLATFQAASDSGLVTAITNASKVYEGYNNYTQLGLKFGTGSAAGTFTATLSQPVSTISVTAVGWNSSDTLELSSGDVNVSVDGKMPAPYSSAEPSAVTFTFSQAVTEFTLTFSNRGFVPQIDFVL